MEDGSELIIEHEKSSILDDNVDADNDVSTDDSVATSVTDSNVTSTDDAVVDDVSLAIDHGSALSTDVARNESILSIPNDLKSDELLMANASGENEIGKQLNADDYPLPSQEVGAMTPPLPPETELSAEDLEEEPAELIQDEVEGDNTEEMKNDAEKIEQVDDQEEPDSDAESENEAE